MGNYIALACGKSATNLRIQHGITCDRVSTSTHHQPINRQSYVKNYLLAHTLYRLFSNQLSPYKNIKLPLMNTIFTQFPQHLLLLPLKKKEER